LTVEGILFGGIFMTSKAEAWCNFQSQNCLSDDSVKKFKIYSDFLEACNQDFNLTAIEGVARIIDFHFNDSLALSKFFDLGTVSSLADVGSGAGFPGVPIKIVYPNVFLTLIEVSEKRQGFLKDLVDLLGLHGVEICGHDWRTFLRKSTRDVDLFVARASLDVNELARIFKPSCRYKNSNLIYWASEKWESCGKCEEYILRQEAYELGTRRRKLVFMGEKENIFKG
jgi:16S rRNA (guanine(527)-N(7))-methyltransferase RsmG